MAVIATDSTRFSEVVAYELEPQLAICRESVVINEDAAVTLKVGAVLGKVTATGKYKLSKAAAVDGSEDPVAVLIANDMGSSSDIAAEAGVDTNALVLARGPAMVKDAGLQLGTGITADAAKAALAAVGIIVETAV